MNDKIEFMIGDLFNHHDDISRFILGLALINNDIQTVSSLIWDEMGIAGDFEFNRKEINENRVIYFSRLLHSHLNEAVKFVHSALQKKTIKNFTENLIVETQDDLKAFLKFWDDEFMKDVIKPIRGSFFHYPKIDDSREELKLIIKKLDSEISFIDTSTNILRTRFDIAEKAVNQLVYGYFGETDVFNSKKKKAPLYMKQFTLINHFMKFTQATVYEYIFSKLEEAGTFA